MTLWRPVQHPASRARARWVFDVAVMLFTFVASLPYLWHHHTNVSASSIVWLAVVVAPLVVRRSWPIPVFAWVVAANSLVALWNPAVIAACGLLVALYTVAALRPRREAFVCAGVLEVAALVAAIDFPGAYWFYDAFFLTCMVAAAVAIGFYAGTRRAYLLELRDRAERLEREKDQQGALAAAAERARIAREMHDIVAHHLTVMVALSDGAIAASAKSPERGVEVMRSVSATGRRALADTRKLLGVLRSERDGDGEPREPGAPSPTRQPLPDLAELDELIDRVRAAGLPITLEVHGATSRDLPAAVQLTAYRLIQEGLTNTLKHGGSGAHAVVRLHHLPDELRVDIDDDGAGAAAPVPAGVGGGLIGMRERVHAVGGDLLSGPRDLGGWRVSARLRFDPIDIAGDGVEP